MAIEGFQMGPDTAGDLDLETVIEDGIPGATPSGIEIIGQPGATGTARDIPEMEVTPTFDPMDGVEQYAHPAPTGDSAALKAVTDALDEMKSERGRYGREVVGPLRAENDDMRARLVALEGKAQEPVAPIAPPAPAPTYQDVAVALYGDDVDLEDPDTVKHSKAHLAALQLGQSQNTALVAAFREEIGTLRNELGAANAYTQAGVSREQVQNAIKANPELADLPESSVVSFVGRNLQKSRGGPAPAPVPANIAVPAYANPNLAIDGGPSVHANPGDAQSNEDAAYQDLVNVRKTVGFGVGRPSVADIQANKLLKMFGDQQATQVFAQ